MQYQDWFTLYLSTYKRDLKPRTREEYERQHRVYIAPVIGEKPLEDISPEDCKPSSTPQRKTANAFPRPSLRFCARRSGAPSVPAACNGHRWMRLTDQSTDRKRETR